MQNKELLNKSTNTKIVMDKQGKYKKAKRDSNERRNDGTTKN